MADLEETQDDLVDDYDPADFEPEPEDDDGWCEYDAYAREQEAKEIEAVERMERQKKAEKKYPGMHPHEHPPEDCPKNGCDICAAVKKRAKAAKYAHKKACRKKRDAKAKRDKFILWVRETVASKDDEFKAPFLRALLKQVLSGGELHKNLQQLILGYCDIVMDFAGMGDVLFPRPIAQVWFDRDTIKAAVPRGIRSLMNVYNNHKDYAHSIFDEPVYRLHAGLDLEWWRHGRRGREDDSKPSFVGTTAHDDELYRLEWDHRGPTTKPCLLQVDSDFGVVTVEWKQAPWPTGNEAKAGPDAYFQFESGFEPRCRAHDQYGKSTYVLRPMIAREYVIPELEANKLYVPPLLRAFAAFALK